MTDLAERLRIFAVEGFEAGYFVFSEEHLRFYMVHRKEKLRIEILVCFHEDTPRYYFKLWSEEKILLEKKVETDGEMMLVSGEIFNKVQEYKGAEGD